MPPIRRQAQAGPPDSSQHFCTRCRETRQERLSLEPVRVVRMLPVTPDVIDGDVVQFVESQVQAIIPEIRTLQAAKLGRAS